MESVIEPPKGATEKTLPTHNRSSSLDTGGIIAAVIGATLLVGLGVLAFIVLRRKQKDKGKEIELFVQVGVEYV